jgi:AspT/YidE/YbjL antiporter-like protein
MSGSYVINIGRQLGSGGKEIGEKLAARLGIDFYDKELINLASEESGLCREFFEKADEKASQGIIGGLFGMRFPFISEGAMPCTNCLSNDALFKVQSDVIRHLAAEKSCVFVGRCADYILREHPRCVNVFISASKEDRIARLCQIHHIDKEAAEEMMEKADKKRSEYYNYYSYKTWGAAATYHLVTYTTMSANLMLREIGIVLFLASVGIDAGANFVQTVVEGDGLLYVGCGFLITVIPLLIIGAIARLYYKVNYFTLMGLIAGSNTDPPALAYANQTTAGDAPAVGYSTVYPLSMFLRILTGQMILLTMM